MFYQAWHSKCLSTFGTMVMGCSGEALSDKLALDFIHAQLIHIRSEYRVRRDAMYSRISELRGGMTLDHKLDDYDDENKPIWPTWAVVSSQGCEMSKTYNCKRLSQITLDHRIGNTAQPSERSLV